MKNPTDDLVRWASYLARLARAPRTFKVGHSGYRNQEQEMARRRRQMAKHGANYWCPVYRGSE